MRALLLATERRNEVDLNGTCVWGLSARAPKVVRDCIALVTGHVARPCVLAETCPASIGVGSLVLDIPVTDVCVDKFDNEEAD